REILLVDFQQGNVGAWIGTDFFRLVFAQVRAEPDHDFFCARDDMISGENVSVRADDHARAEPLKCLLTLPLRKLSAEELSHRVIGKWKRFLSPRHRLCG